jgi:hypothetical protein
MLREKPAQCHFVHHKFHTDKQKVGHVSTANICTSLADQLLGLGLVCDNKTCCLLRAVYIRSLLGTGYIGSLFHLRSISFSGGPCYMQLVEQMTV